MVTRSTFSRSTLSPQTRMLCDEADWGCDPLNPDTDGDTWPDGVELVFGTDPLNPASFPAN